MKSNVITSTGCTLCRSPCGERGLKFAVFNLCKHRCNGRSPCGERGLKFLCAIRHP